MLFLHINLELRTVAKEMCTACSSKLKLDEKLNHLKGADLSD
jgi:hypothetical protein